MGATSRGLQRWMPCIASVILAGAATVRAQDAIRGEAGAHPAAVSSATEADYDVLRRLLGVQPPPSRAQQPAAAVPAVEAEPKTVGSQPTTPVVTPAAKRGLPAPAAAKRSPAVTPTRPAVTARPTVSPEAPREAAPAAAAPAPSFISSDIPPPGTVIEASNLDRWKDLVSPSIQWAVRRGARLPIIENQPLPMEPARAEATKRYSPQVQLSDDKTYVVNYVAGIPFPFVQTDDRDAGIKMILNWDGRVVSDDVEVRNFGCQTGSFGAHTGMNVERYYISSHFRRLYYVGRLYNDPQPTWPNAEGFRYRETLGPLVDPFDLKGSGLTYNRYQDARRQDDSWLYYPISRRVRRLSTAQRSEGVFGQDVDLDSYGGYSGNPSWTDWRLLGTKTILATMHGRSMPTKWLPPPNDFIFDDVWEPRDVWVIEGRSRLPGYAYKSRVMYVDRESFVIAYTEMFDLQGRLWKSLLQNWQARAKMRPESKYDVDYVRVVTSGITMFDLQLNHATRCQLPDQSIHNEDGWYLNVGAREGMTQEDFDISALIDSGR